MVPPSSVWISRVPTYSGYRPRSSSFTYETFTLSGWPSHTILLDSNLLFPVLTPQIFLLAVWPLPRSLATTNGISVDFSSSGYLDVSVPRVPFVQLWIHCTICNSSLQGFPHSEICGSWLIYSLPQLIAVSHVLLRLLMPRHSPYALVRLNFVLSCLSFANN